ncbi:MAG TPA: YbaK/EbsC family protein [Solirubrobacteraceae bacterium]|jgi:prolyl-tRNA editing enzyme YbaK/EbsC (Cys-tRNA(Pro) deacylase)|nr:YbaK/EbsC family protein [Solirubrobacteraceae bacterium]
MSEGEGAIARTRAQAIAEYLEGMGVAHEIVEHAPTTRAAAEARAAGRMPDQAAKTVVLHDGAAYVIAAVPAACRLDLRKLRDLLGASRRLRLASEEEIARDFPAFEVGAVPPFGPMVPAAEVIDGALVAQESVLFPAGDHRHSVLVDPREVVRITAAVVADVSED